MIRYTKAIIAINFCLLILLCGCKKEPNGGVPIYLQIDSSRVVTSFDQGSGSQKISDIWVTANGIQIGVFQIPAKVPILASGDVRIILSAGIRDNGISNTRIEYPFYSVEEFVIAGAENGKTYQHTPTFTYAPFAAFSFIEDFEGSNAFTNVAGVNDEVYEGGSSGRITLGPNDTAVVAYNTTGFTIPALGKEVYLEMDYKCDNYFELGLITNKNGSYSNLYKMTLNPRANWNKIYVNLNNEVGAARADDYRIYFKLVQFTKGVPVNVWIDNLKVVNYIQ
jgi:hypothetical protein